MNWLEEIIELGWKDKKSILTRKWSTGTVYPTSNNIYESLKKENACLTLGHIFIYSENWINNLEQFID